MEEVVSLNSAGDVNLPHEIIFEDMIVGKQWLVSALVFVFPCSMNITGSDKKF